MLIAEANKMNPIYKDAKNIHDDKFLGAMRLRHAYAITCHKAQGGEWVKVYIEPTTRDYLDKKWLYTALTRASKEVNSWAA